MALGVSYVLVVLTVLSMDVWISQATSRVDLQELSIANYFQQWMIKFSRVYSNEAEKQMRLEVFKKNLEYIEHFNSMPNQSYKLGVNEFADLTEEEFTATHTGLIFEE
ncbi:Cysteine proteinases superfamily protein [Raphanus sativus]|nr:Cysteine proteinases superfamily protein [Raphanus sativus]